MEEHGDTASLRSSAAHWTLAGDKQLLGVLQGIHERIIAKCQATNSSLEEMVRSLDTASVKLQNVNNRFMALSNSKFVESRVYDDDVDVAATEEPVKEPPKPTETTTDLDKLKESLRVLESFHEGVQILDSDSDSASDEEERLVYKPKDLYTERPLPYIIGSQQWRSKWHAGLIPEDSDSDSGGSQRDRPPSELFSESESDLEPEGEGEAEAEGAAAPHAVHPTISTTSWAGSERRAGAGAEGARGAGGAAGGPAEVAAALARRLGGAATRVPEPELEPELPPAVVPTKVYKPQQPTAAILFADEPPPLDQYQSDSASEDDIFAELHKNKPRQTEKQFGSVVDELFGNQPYEHRNKVDDDIFGGYIHQSTPNVKQNSSLFTEPQGSDLFTETAQKPPAPDTDRQTDVNVKKPVGGISLFGNNKGTESIGAAILKRNQHKGSTDDESEVDKPVYKTPNKPADSVEKAIKVNDTIEPEGTKVGHVADKHVGEKTEKDIINDLFTKPKTNVAEDKEKVVDKHVKKVDLFSDNLFDDIDDIFTSNVTNKDKRKESNKNKKSLFDDDDDDLFADVAVSNKSSTQDNRSSVEKNKSRSEPKGLFDSDDDLFTEKPSKPDNVVKTNEVTRTAKVASENELLVNKINTEQTVKSKECTQSSIVENKAILNNEVTGEGSINRLDDSLNQEKKPLNVHKAKSKVKSIFDSDSDDDIFADFKASKFLANDKKREENQEALVKKNSNNKDEIKPKEIPKLDKLDDFDSEDSLFMKNETEIISSKEIQVTDNNIKSNKNMEVDEFVDDLFKSNKKTEALLAENKEQVINKVVEEKEIYNEVKNKVNEDVNELFSNKNKIEAKSGLSNILSDNGILKSQAFRSPSLFGDDDDNDDTDDLFNKTTGGNSSNDGFKEVKTPEINPVLIEEQKNNNVRKRLSGDDTSRTNIAISKNNSISPIINDSSNDVKEISSSDIIVNENTIHDYTKRNTFIYHDDEQGKEIVSNITHESPPPDLPHEDININDSIPGNSKEDVVIDPTDEFIQEEPLFLEAKEPVSNEPDIFSDIFSDVPPEFEKPKEPKKSRNINALFDDDSDDEALFFKRDDTVTDEKPDISFGTQERLFHIFHDEPPAIDVNFTQKHNDGTEDITKDTILPKQSTDGVDSITKVNNLDMKKSQIDNEQVIKINNEITRNDNIDLSKDVDEVKKPVGKLKPMNLNINVTSLLPGASPKKIKSYEQTDGQVATKNVDDLSPKDEEPKMVKSVSFEGDPDSEVLDNKLSKERAKIQVKRRPSTRRARREAVRKSGIDFGDDSTDNSGSIDLPKNTEVAADTVDYKFEKDDLINDLNHIPKVDILDRTDKDVAVATAVADSSTIETVGVVSDANNEMLDKREASVTTGFNTRTNIKSKVVYILNDEDIFTNTTPESQINKQSKSDELKVNKNKVLNIVDDDDELFRTKDVTIGTLGNAYKDVKQKEIDRFDSDEDIFKASLKTKSDDRVEGNRTEINRMEAKIDELFVKTTKVTKNKTKPSVYDVSDDEDELFGSKHAKKANVFDNEKLFSGPSNVKEGKKERDLKLPVKGSLFGDDSDDDLFGGKAKNPEPLHIQPKPKEVAPKTSEPVFEDPLSMRDDEDDL